MWVIKYWVILFWKNNKQASFDTKRFTEFWDRERERERRRKRRRRRREKERKRWKTERNGARFDMITKRKGIEEKSYMERLDSQWIATYRKSRTIDRYFAYISFEPCHVNVVPLVVVEAAVQAPRTMDRFVIRMSLLFVANGEMQLAILEVDCHMDTGNLVSCKVRVGRI